MTVSAPTLASGPLPQDARATLPLAPLYAAGNVTRWHQNPAMARAGQTNADHQGRCLQLLLMLHPAPSLALIRAVAFHDVGERVVGDLSGPFKTAAPDLAITHAQAEAAARQAIAGPDDYLTMQEAAWLKLIDQLEAHAFALFHNRAEYMRPSSGWKEAEARLFARAEALGVRDRVLGLLVDICAGDW